MNKKMCPLNEPKQLSLSFMHRDGLRVS